MMWSFQRFVVDLLLWGRIYLRFFGLWITFLPTATTSGSNEAFKSCCVIIFLIWHTSCIDFPTQPMGNTDINSFVGLCFFTASIAGIISLSPEIIIALSYTSFNPSSCYIYVSSLFFIVLIVDLIGDTIFLYNIW